MTRRLNRANWRVQGRRFEIRRVLYMATLTAARYNQPSRPSTGDLKAQLASLLKVALVACMRKLLTTLNAMVRTGKLGPVASYA